MHRFEPEKSNPENFAPVWTSFSTSASTNLFKFPPIQTHFAQLREICFVPLRTQSTLRSKLQNLCEFAKFTSSANWKVRVQNSLLSANCNRTTKSPPARHKISRARKNWFELTRWNLIACELQSPHTWSTESPRTLSSIRDPRPRKFYLNHSNSKAIRTDQPIKAILDKLLRLWSGQLNVHAVACSKVWKERL